jgi:predicted dehydrogenase
VIVHFHVSWLSPRKVRDITVVGDRGMLTFDDMNLMEPLRFYDKVVTDARTPGFVDTFASFRTSVREGDIVIPRVGAVEPLKAECDHFLDCIRNGTRPISDGRSGADAVRTLAAIQKSLAHHGQREDV